ncbi:MAG: hypothetical protein R3C30_13125 [Hyphomonadaceae bacterium]
MKRPPVILTLAFTMLAIGLPVVFIGSTIGMAFGQDWVPAVLIFVFLCIFALLGVIAGAVEKRLGPEDDAAD